MIITLISSLIIIPTISFTLALVAKPLSKKYSFFASLLVYLTVLGTISIWRGVSQGVSMYYILLSIIIYLTLSAAILSLMSKALERWLTSTVMVNYATVREMGARNALAHSPDEPHKLFEWFSAEGEIQGRSMNIPNAPFHESP